MQEKTREGYSSFFFTNIYSYATHDLIIIYLKKWNYLKANVLFKQTTRIKIILFIVFYYFNLSHVKL